MRFLITGLLCFLSAALQANVIQYFAGISYANPADFFKVKKDLLVFGSTEAYADLSFRGTVLNFNTFQYDGGENHSRTLTSMPYGRLARRLNEKTVIDLDVTQPFNSNLNWGTDAFTRYANTQNYLTDIDISPKIAYSLKKNLHVGAGLNCNFVAHNEINWAYPTSEFSSANLVNRTSSFGLGYDLGVTYLFNETNILSLTYYSTIRQNTTGESTLGPNYNDKLAMSFNLPATTIVNYVHIFTPKWLLSMQLFQSEWDINQQVRVYNTAVLPPRSNFFFDMNFKTSYAFLAAVRHQWTEQLGVTIAGLVDDSPEQDNLRTITFPCYPQYFMGLIGDYHFNKNTSMELLYAHVFSNPGFGNSVTVEGVSMPFTTGQSTINADVVDLRVKVEG